MQPVEQFSHPHKRGGCTTKFQILREKYTWPIKKVFLKSSTFADEDMYSSTNFPL